MKVTKKKLDDGKVMLEAVATPDEVNKALHQAQLQFAMQMGLRPQKDKTIAEVAEETMGIKDLDSIVNSQAVDYLVPFALDKKGITPAYAPKGLPQSSLKRGREFAFRVTVLPKPDYDLESYDPVDITVEPFKKDDAAVEKQLREMAENYAIYETADPKPVEKGSHVLLKIKAFENGEPLTGLSTDGRTYSVGLGYMPEGFDENIIGMNVGDEKEFTFEGPSFDDEGNPTTETVRCIVTVLETQKRVIPEITDEWVKTYMPMYPNAAAVREEVDRQVNGARKAQYDDYVRGMAASKLSERFKGKIDDAVYEAMRDNIMSNLRQSLEQQDMTFDDFVEQNGGRQMFDMQIMLQTRQNLVQGFSLDALFRHEGLIVSDEDINEVCAMINPRNPRATRREFEDNGRNFALREIAERLCANKWLVEHANITYKDPAASEEPATDEAPAAESAPEAAEATEPSEA